MTISVGYEHTCALSMQGNAICWGEPNSENDFNQAIPPDPPEGGRLVSISSGRYHTCALRESGSPVCWAAQRGDEITHRSGASTKIGFGQSAPPEGERFSSISSGAFHTCALRLEGTPVCWGKGFSPAE